MRTIGELLRATESDKKEYKSILKQDVATLVSALTGKICIKVRLLYLSEVEPSFVTVFLKRAL